MAFHESSPLARDTKGFPEQGLRRTGAKTNQHFGPYHLQLSIKPRTAGFDLRVARLFVDSPLAALSGDLFEMLDHIRDVDL